MKGRGVRYLTAALLILSLALLPACTQKSVRPAPSDDGQAVAGGTGAGMPRTEGGPGYEGGADFREESLEDSGRAGAQTAAAMKITRERFENQDVYFDFDSAKLTAEAQEILRQKADWLRRNPAVRVRVEGHCDDRGTNEYNLALGESRAENAKEYLVALGVEESRLSTVSYGEERPLVPGSSEEARAHNRRAHFDILN
ncbi:MAG TPA: peptidoglycan-associated lipoprotein Pal [Desulfobacterales bacterium]